MRDCFVAGCANDSLWVKLLLPWWAHIWSALTIAHTFERETIESSAVPRANPNFRYNCDIILKYFSKRINKPCVNFLCAWTKNANCWEILRKFWKFLMKILLKNWIFILFLFKIIFNLVFENLLLNIEPSEITPVFYHNFFGFGWGGISPFPPWLRPCRHGFSEGSSQICNSLRLPMSWRLSNFFRVVCS